METKKATKRQPTSVPLLTPTSNGLHFDVDQGEVADGILHGVDLSEPTMGEKLADLSFPDDNKFRSDKEQDSSVPTKPPSADSVDFLLRQALNADDCTLLLDCLYTQDEMVITKSIAQLNPSNVLKFLHSLVSITESRGAVMTCALPWLKCLILQHASVIMSQESSLHVLNSLYQVVDEEVDEGETVPVFYEDEDSAEESEDLESDQDDSDEDGSEGVSDIEESNDMMSERSCALVFYFYFFALLITKPQLACYWVYRK